jgi:O-antigen ligase
MGLEIRCEILKKLKAKSTILLLGLVAVYPILPNAPQSIFVGLFLGSILLNFEYKHTKLFFYFTAIISIMFLWSFINTTNYYEFWKRFYVFLPILFALPLFSFFKNTISNKVIEIVKIIFVLSMLVYSFLYFNFYFTGYSLYESLKINIYSIANTQIFSQINFFEKILFFLDEPNCFFNSEYAYSTLNLNPELFRHHLYLNFYYLLSIIFVIDYTKNNSSIINHIFGFLVNSYFVFCIFFMRSDSKYLFIVYTIILYCLQYVKYRLFKILFVILFILSIIFILLSYSNLTQFQFINTNNSEQISIVDFQRYTIWNNIVNHISISDIIFGIGLGDIQDFLYSILPTSIYSQDINKNFIFLNSHNQYIDILLSFGVIGLLCFVVFSSFILFKYYRKTNNYIYFLYILLLYFLFNFENMLSRAWGVFIVIFCSFIMLNEYRILSKGSTNIND